MHHQRANVFEWLAPFLISLALLSGCSSSANEGVVRSDGEIWPAKFRIAYSASTDEPEGRMARYEELAEYLQQELGIPVELVMTSSYGPMIEAMRADKVDAAGGSPFPYMIAHQKAGAEALLQRGKPDGSGGTYSTIIVTSPKTGIRSMADLKARAKQSTFAFVDPASTSGHLVPRAYLESQGMNPEEAFREVVFTQQHLNSVMTAIAAKVDAAAISETTYRRFLEKGRIKEGELIVLWKSKPVPSAVWYVRGELPAGLKTRFRTAFLEMHQRRPTLIEKFRKAVIDPEMVFVPMADSELDGVREVARNVESMTLFE